MNIKEIKQFAKDTLDDWKNSDWSLEMIIEDERGAWTGSEEDLKEFIEWLRFYYNNGYENN